MEAESDLEDLELSLRALEKLDRSSPDLWPEQIPGVSQFIPPTPSTNHSSPSAQVSHAKLDLNLIKLVLLHFATVICFRFQILWIRN